MCSKIKIWVVSILNLNYLLLLLVFVMVHSIDILDVVLEDIIYMDVKLGDVHVDVEK